MGTYSSNSEIKLDTGRPITEMLDEDLTTDEQQNVIRAARQQAFDRINAKIYGKTAIPAFHIPSLKQVEIDYVIADLVISAYTLESVNQSEWAEKYINRANEILDSMQFESSNEDVVAYSGNTGNGRLTLLKVYDDYVKTETWTFRALSATEFSVNGSVTGSFPTLTVDVLYPEKSWGSGTINDYGLTLKNFPSVGQTPFDCKIVPGSIDFELGDVFTVKTYSSENKRSSISSGKIIRA